MRRTIDEAIEDLERVMWDALRTAQTELNDVEYCGGPDDEGWQNGFQRIQAEMIRFESMLKGAMEHEHSWDENGMCGCGMDGNA